MSTPRATLDLDDLLVSWTLSLRAERKSPQTLQTYTDGVKAYLRWLDEQEEPHTITRDHLRGFGAALLDAGSKPTTVASRHLAVRRFSAWIADEELEYRDEVATLKAPKIDEPTTIPLTDEQVRALVNACRGATRSKKSG